MVPSQDTQLDPVCGMWLKTTQIAATYTFIGTTYAFCSYECYELFIHAPEQMISVLAHDSRGHCGHCCPQQRRERGSSAAGLAT